MARRGSGSKNEDKEELPRKHRPTNKASIGRKAALGLRQIAALMAPSVPSLRSHRQVTNAATSCICQTLARPGKKMRTRK
jgi:hypothetical protein